MTPTPPNQPAGQSQAQPPTQDGRLTNGLRWTAAVSGTLCVMILAGLYGDFKETRDNQLRLGIIVDNLSQVVSKIQNDEDKRDSNYQRVLERQQMHHLAIQELQRRSGLR
jgi:hypothetical protein